MRLLQFFIQAIVNLYSFSANPNLFGSKKLENVAGMARKRAEGTQMDIESLQSMNPFETAAAKSAMEKASRTSKQMQTRMLNTMGENASPEALVAAQGTLNEGIGAAAGEIATGAEAAKNAEILQLKGLQEEQMGQYGELKSNAFNTRNAMVMQLLNPISKGLGEAAGGKLASKAGGIAKVAAAASDERIKDNIKLIGNIQGHDIYKYNFKGEPETHIGVIAQDIESENPEVVISSDGIKKVNYDKLFSEIKK